MPYEPVGAEEGRRGGGDVGHGAEHAFLSSERNESHDFEGRGRKRASKRSDGGKSTARADARAPSWKERCRDSVANKKSQGSTRDTSRVRSRNRQGQGVRWGGTDGTGKAPRLSLGLG